MSLVRRGIKRYNSSTQVSSWNNNNNNVPLSKDHRQKPSERNSENTKKCKKQIQIPSPIDSRPTVFQCQYKQQRGISVKGSTATTAEIGHYDEYFSERDILGRYGFFLHSGKLGSGRYCKVRLAEYMTGASKNSEQDAKVAVKIIETSQVRSEFLQKFLPREINIWPRLQHPHLVKMLSFFKFSTKVFLILEYVGGGDLLTFIQQNGSQPEGAARYWMLQMINAVAYMHSNGVAHRDLKLENILLDKTGNIKITDFGFCRQIQSGPGGDERGGFLSKTYCGSKAYSAPEILQGVEYDPPKVDIWSLGVVGFILVTGRMPFNENVSNQLLIVEAQRKRSYTYPPKLYISSHCHQAIDTMMTFDWRERPDIFSVKNLTWIKRTFIH